MFSVGPLPLFLSLTDSVRQARRAGTACALPVQALLALPKIPTIRTIPKRPRRHPMTRTAASTALSLRGPIPSHS